MRSPDSATEIERMDFWGQVPPSISERLVYVLLLTDGANEGELREVSAKGYQRSITQRSPASWEERDGWMVNSQYIRFSPIHEPNVEVNATHWGVSHTSDGAPFRWNKLRTAVVLKQGNTIQFDPGTIRCRTK